MEDLNMIIQGKGVAGYGPELQARAIEKSEPVEFMIFSWCQLFHFSLENQAKIIKSFPLSFGKQLGKILKIL